MNGQRVLKDPQTVQAITSVFCYLQNLIIGSFTEDTTQLSHCTWRTHSGRDLDASSLLFSIHSIGRFFINRIKAFKAAPSVCYMKSSQINNPFHSSLIFLFKQIKHRIEIPKCHSWARISLTVVSLNIFKKFGFFVLPGVSIAVI